MTTAHRTLLDCVEQYFQHNPEEVLSIKDIATKFDVPKHGIQSQLSVGLQMGTLVRRRDTDLTWLYSKGQDQQKEALQPKASTTHAPESTSARHEIHPGDVQIHKGVPIPRERPQRGAWTSLLLKMETGDCTDLLPLSLTSTMRNAMKEAIKQCSGAEFVLRRVDENGRIRVWRTA